MENFEPKKLRIVPDGAKVEKSAEEVEVDETAEAYLKALGQRGLKTEDVSFPEEEDTKRGDGKTAQKYLDALAQRELKPEEEISFPDDNKDEKEARG